jgi:predicted dinucleotide-binding enzyme
MNRNVVAGTVGFGAIGYGLALLLARAAVVAETDEEEAYCHEPATEADRAGSRQVPAAV